MSERTAPATPRTPASALGSIETYDPPVDPAEADSIITQIRQRGWPLPQPDMPGAPRFETRRSCAKGCCRQENPRDVGEFARHYEVFAGLLPFEYKTLDLLDALVQVADAIADLPPTKQSFTTTNLVRTHTTLGDILESAQQGGAASFPEAMFMLHGSFPMPERAGTARAFANPGYVHLGHLDDAHYVTDDAHREVWLDNYAALGVVALAQIAPHFDLSTDGLRAWIADRAYPWHAKRLQGLRLLARTAKTMAAWGRAPTTIARGLGVSPAAYARLVARFAPRFDPPADPSGVGSFHM